MDTYGCWTPVLHYNLYEVACGWPVASLNYLGYQIYKIPPKYSYSDWYSFIFHLSLLLTRLYIDSISFSFSDRPSRVGGCGGCGLLNFKTIFPGTGNPILKMRWSWGHLNFLMGIHVLVRSSARTLYWKLASINHRCFWPINQLRFENSNLLFSLQPYYQKWSSHFGNSNHYKEAGRSCYSK